MEAIVQPERTSTHVDILCACRLHPQHIQAGVVIPCMRHRGRLFTTPVSSIYIYVLHTTPRHVRDTHPGWVRDYHGRVSMAQSYYFYC